MMLENDVELWTCVLVIEVLWAVPLPLYSDYEWTDLTRPLSYFPAILPNVSRKTSSNYRTHRVSSVVYIPIQGWLVLFTSVLGLQVINYPLLLQVIAYFSQHLHHIATVDKPISYLLLWLVTYIANGNCRSVDSKDYLRKFFLLLYPLLKLDILDSLCIPTLGIHQLKGRAERLRDGFRRVSEILAWRATVSRNWL